MKEKSGLIAKTPLAAFSYYIPFPPPPACSQGGHVKEVGTKLSGAEKVQANKALRSCLTAQLDSAAGSFGSGLVPGNGVPSQPAIKKEKVKKAGS